MKTTTAFSLPSSLLAAFALLSTASLHAQQEPAPEPDAPQVTQQVDVDGVVGDADIATRLNDILNATGWFTDAQARVENGVV